MDNTDVGGWNEPQGALAILDAHSRSCGWVWGVELVRALSESWSTLLHSFSALLCSLSCSFLAFSRALATVLSLLLLLLVSGWQLGTGTQNIEECDDWSTNEGPGEGPAWVIHLLDKVWRGAYPSSWCELWWVRDARKWLGIMLGREEDMPSHARGCGGASLSHSCCHWVCWHVL